MLLLWDGNGVVAYRTQDAPFTFLTFYFFTFLLFTFLLFYFFTFTS